MDTESQNLLNLIDNRIKKIINQEKFLYVYSAIVTLGGIHGSECKVHLAGFPETEFTFLNKSHETLSISDSVYILTIGKDLNTGVISQKYN